MSLKTLIISQNQTLYNILNEISVNLNFKVIYINNNTIPSGEYGEYLIITQNKELNQKNQVYLSEFPIKIKRLLKIINTNFLKKKYNSQSSIEVNNYTLDLNSRILSSKNENLDLTEMEAKVILFLKQIKEPSSIKELQKKVWGQMPDLETHTVETHIYRLRKKIKDKFQDNDFIKSTKNGYQITQKK